MSNQKTHGKATTKPTLNQKAKLKLAAAPLLPPVQGQEVFPMCEESTDVSMKEQELCQAFSDVLLTVEDIDEQDGDMPQLCAEYVKDIYSYLMALEVNYTSRWMYCHVFSSVGSVFIQTGFSSIAKTKCATEVLARL